MKDSNRNKLNNNLANERFEERINLVKSFRTNYHKIKTCEGYCSTKEQITNLLQDVEDDLRLMLEDMITLQEEIKKLTKNNQNLRKVISDLNDNTTEIMKENVSYKKSNQDKDHKIRDLYTNVKNLEKELEVYMHTSKINNILEKLDRVDGRSTKMDTKENREIHEVYHTDNNNNSKNNFINTLGSNKNQNTLYNRYKANYTMNNNYENLNSDINLKYHVNDVRNQGDLDGDSGEDNGQMKRNMNTEVIIVDDNFKNSMNSAQYKNKKNTNNNNDNVFSQIEKQKEIQRTQVNEILNKHMTHNNSYNDTNLKSDKNNNSKQYIII